jgi:hypothetical protein
MAPLVEYEDVIGITYGGNPVRNTDRDSLPHDAFETRQDFFFGAGIDCLRVVEDQDLRIDDNRSRQPKTVVYDYTVRPLLGTVV